MNLRFTSSMQLKSRPVTYGAASFFTRPDEAIHTSRTNSRSRDVLVKTLTHLQLTLIALLFYFAVAITLSILIYWNERLAPAVHIRRREGHCLLRLNKIQQVRIDG